MANQNIGTPRFYIDIFQYYKATAIGTANNAPPNLFGLNTSEQYWLETDDYGDDVHKTFRSLDFPTGEIPNLNYIAVLGHNFGNFTTGGFHMRLDSTSISNDYVERPIDYEITNTSYSNNFNAEFSGFSITEITPPTTPADAYRINFRLQGTDASPIGICALSTGYFYDMPHSPELSLTMSHEYDGIKKQETAGGSTLSYANYYKPPDWGDLQAWQLSGWDRKYSGRRVLDLSWNHLSDSDLEPYHYHMDRGTGGGLGSHPNWNDDGNFFTNVLHYTNGGQLPFIFCPDPSIPYTTSTWTIPEFAICRFDMKTFKREQVANGIYNIKVKIKESW